MKLLRRDSRKGYLGTLLLVFVVIVIFVLLLTKIMEMKANALG